MIINFLSQIYNSGYQAHVTGSGELVLDGNNGGSGEMCLGERGRY